MLNTERWIDKTKSRTLLYAYILHTKPMPGKQAENDNVKLFPTSGIKYQNDMVKSVNWKLSK